MNLLDCIVNLNIFQRLSNLSTSHVKLTRIIFIEITGQGAERLLSGESERSSHFRFVLSPATVVRLTVVDSVLNPLRFEEP